MKEQQLFPNKTPEQRAQMIKDNAYSVETRTYQKRFEQDEIEVFKSNLSDALIQINALNDELREFKASHKLKTAPLQKKLTGLLGYIKHGSREITEEVYLMEDHKAGVMTSYDIEGNVVSERKMLPAERQTKMRLLNATGTEG